MNFKNVHIWFAAPIALIVAWVLMFYIPLYKQIKGKEKELVGVKQERQTLENEVRNLFEIKRKDEQTKATTKELQAKIPVFDEFPGLMREVLSISKQYGLILTGVDSTAYSLDIKKAPPLMNPTLEIDLRGRFMEIGRFLETLGENPAFKGIAKATIAYNEKEYPILTGKFVIEFKTWRNKAFLESK